MSSTMGSGPDSLGPLFGDVDDMTEAMQQGRMEGMHVAQKDGLHEGRRLGQAKGVEYGMELGFAMGMVESVQEWLTVQRSEGERCGNTSTHSLDRIEKTCQNLDQAIWNFPDIHCLLQTSTEKEEEDKDLEGTATNQQEDDDIRKNLQRIRALSKVLSSKLGMPRYSLQAILEEKPGAVECTTDDVSAESIRRGGATNNTDTTNEW